MPMFLLPCEVGEETCGVNQLLQVLILEVFAAPASLTELPGNMLFVVV